MKENNSGHSAINHAAANVICNESLDFVTRTEACTTQADVDAKLDAWEAKLLPARRWDHTAFLMPTAGATGRSGAESGSGSALSSSGAAVLDHDHNRAQQEVNRHCIVSLAWWTS